MTNVVDLKDFQKSSQERYLENVDKQYSEAGLTDEQRKEALSWLESTFEFVFEPFAVEGNLEIPEDMEITRDQVESLKNSVNKLITDARRAQRRHGLNVIAGLIANMITARDES